MSLNKNIVCTVVLYRKTLLESEVYKTLLRDNVQHIDCLLVFDNSPEKRTVEMSLPHGEFHYISNMKNLGLSENYNAAAQFAVEHDYDWILLLDEDTTFPPEALLKYKAAIEEHPQIQLFVPTHRIANGKLLSPSRPFKGLLKDLPSGIYPLRKLDVINSGLMVAAEDFLAVGGYKPEVNLDFSDYQFIERLRSRCREMAVLNFECLQDFSNDETNKEKLLCRFELYCRNAAHFEAYTLRSRWNVNILIAKHTLAIGLRCRKLGVRAFMCILWKGIKAIRLFRNCEHKPFTT